MLKLRKGKVLDNRKEKAWRETFYHLKFRPVDCIDLETTAQALGHMFQWRKPLLSLI